MTENGKNSGNEIADSNFCFSLKMQKDQRYEFARIQLERGKITEFNQIFKYIPKSVVAGDLGTARPSFNKKINRVEKFTFEDIYAIGRFMGIEDISSLFKLIDAQYIIQKKKKKK